jgi:hypothetical protein
MSCCLEQCENMRKGKHNPPLQPTRKNGLLLSMGMPEQPVIGLVFRTDESRILESVVHGVMNLRGQWSETSPGTEWFVTSPADVLVLIRQLVPGTTADKGETT